MGWPGRYWKLTLLKWMLAVWGERERAGAEGGEEILGGTDMSWNITCTEDKVISHVHHESQARPGDLHVYQSLPDLPVD